MGDDRLEVVRRIEVIFARIVDHPPVAISQRRAVGQQLIDLPRLKIIRTLVADAQYESRSDPVIRQSCQSVIPRTV
jgi:hypothetical protein